MQITNYNSLPEAAKEKIKSKDFAGYAKVYYRGAHFGSRLFLKAENETMKEIHANEMHNCKQYTNEMQAAFKDICVMLFVESGLMERWEVYEFCKKLGFQEKDNELTGYYCCDNLIVEIIASNDTGYCLKVNFYEI